MVKDKNKPNKIFLFIFIVLLILILKFIVYFVMYEEKLVSRDENADLKKDGYTVFKEVLSIKEIEYLTNLCDNDQHKEAKHYLMEHKKIKKLIEYNTNKNYIFQDYVFIIKKSAIHTCHRDSNGDFFNKDQKYPSYTMLIFLEDMDKCLGVIPKSHFDVNSFNYNAEDEVLNILCKKGDGIIFNANLIHVGALNSQDNHLRIQMKITHKDDIPAIPFYNQYNKVLDQENHMPFFLRKAQRKLSCMFPIVSTFTQTEIQEVAGGQEIGIGQKIFSYIFYGNSNFYNLPNAY
jgi:hypothetical protein